MYELDKNNTAHNPVLASYWLQQAFNTNVNALEQQAQWLQAEFTPPEQTQVVWIPGNLIQKGVVQTEVVGAQTGCCIVRGYQAGTFEILPSLKDRIQSSVEKVVFLAKEIENRDQFTSIQKWLFHGDIFNCLKDAQIEEAIAIARYVGFEATANRLLELKLDEDELETDEQPLNLLSIKQFLRFLLNHPELKEPGIVITNEGNVKAIWQESQNQIFWIEFSPNDDVRYLAFVPNERRSDGIECTAGWSTIPDVYDRAKEFHATAWMEYDTTPNHPG